MEPPTILYKVDPKRLEVKSELRGVYLTKPRLVALYDVNYDSVKPAKKIFYFKNPNFRNYPIDLNIGYSTYTKRKKDTNSTSKALEYTLKYAMSPKAQINIDNVDKTKVFARRGTLVELMSCYYGKKFKKCLIRVSRYNADIYMVHVEDETVSNENDPKHTHHEQFLRSVFSDSPKNEPKTYEPIDENKRLIGVHKSSLGKFDMIYHGEIQGIRSDKEIKNFDDLDTLNACRFVMAKQLWASVKRDDSKHFRYWLQTYLANVLDIYFAYKDSAGIVHRPIVHKLTSEIVKEFKWKPGIYTEFLYEFLQRVNDLMTNDNINSLSTVYEISFDSEVKTFSYKIFKENPEKIFITQEYMDYCKQL